MSEQFRIAQLRAEASEIIRRGSQTPTNSASTTIRYVGWNDWYRLVSLTQEAERLEKSADKRDVDPTK